MEGKNLQVLGEGIDLAGFVGQAILPLVETCQVFVSQPPTTWGQTRISLPTHGRE